MKLGALLFSPRGQTKRIEFLKGFVVAFLLVCFFTFAPSLVCPRFPDIFSTNLGKLSIAASYISGVILTFYSICICLACKRLRDMGYSPWWFILPCLPFLHFLYLILFVYPGQKNKPVYAQ